MDAQELLTEEAKKAKVKLIKAEKTRLLKLLGNLAGDKKKAAEGLIDECSYMRATLKQLRSFIDENGFVDEMPQGDYSILRESPAMRSYNTMVPKYAAICKQLFDMLPDKGNVSSEGDEFENLRQNKYPVP